MTEVICATTSRMQKVSTRLVMHNPSIIVLPQAGENTVFIDQNSFNEHFPRVAEVSIPPVRKKKGTSSFLQESSNKYTNEIKRKNDDKRAREEVAATNKKKRQEESPAQKKNVEKQLQSRWKCV